MSEVLQEGTPIELTEVVPVLNRVTDRYVRLEPGEKGLVYRYTEIDDLTRGLRWYEVAGRIGGLTFHVALREDMFRVTGEPVRRARNRRSKYGTH